jgi:hypothetical protein
LPTADRQLWIDALCINQAQTNERDAQVRQMHNIYATAKRVLAWLGPASQYSDIAMQLIQEAESKGFDSAWLEKVVREDKPSDAVHSLTGLCLRDYWLRVWIVPEIAQAKEVLVVCGSLSADYASLTKLIAKLHSYSLVQFLPNGVLKQSIQAGMPLLLVSMPNRNPQKGASSFLDVGELFQITRFRQCKDSRDKIFAMHSLLIPDLQKEISPLIKYSSKKRDIFASTARAIIETTGRIDSITWKPHPYGPSLSACKTLKIPSWVMNWESAGYIVPYSHDTRFHADGSTAPSFVFDNDNSILRARGVRLGSVKNLQRGIRKSESHLDRIVPFTAILKHANVCLDLLRQHSVFDQRAFLMTCLGGLPDGREDQQPWAPLLNLLSFALSDQISQVTQQLENHQDNVLGQFVSDQAIKAFLLIQPPEHRAMSQQQQQNNTELSFPTIGIACGSPEPGDIIAVLIGCRAPVVLRPAGQRYQVIGDAYVYGFMRGEALRGINSGQLEEDFVLT